MPRRMILISHDQDEKDDRASAWLRAQGHGLHWCCPAAGEPIPEPHPGDAGAVIYGGKYDVEAQARYPFLTDELRFIETALKRRMPLLGLCLGGQLMAHVLGEAVGRHPQGHAEYGYYDLKPTAAGCGLFGTGLKVLQSHWHGWHGLPRGAVHLAQTELYPQQAFRYGANAFAFQFHPEASLATLERWIARRPSERHRLPGACPPERQLTDHHLYDTALGHWFLGFLRLWTGMDEVSREAAE